MTDTANKCTLTASGSATTSVPPDAARLFLRIDTEAKQIAEARSRNSADFEQVRVALNELHIPDLKMRTVQWSLNPVMTTKEPIKLRGYVAVNQFTVLLTDSDAQQLSSKAGRVLQAVLENGVTSFEHINYFLQNDREVRRRTLTLAVEDALRNAEALAAGLGVKIRPLTLTDTTSGNGFRYGGQSRQAMPLVAAETQLVAGDMVITCRVNLVCEFE
jgi:uncharacterized protein YggE